LIAETYSDFPQLWLCGSIELSEFVTAEFALVEDKQQLDRVTKLEAGQSFHDGTHTGAGVQREREQV
jgi:hypothetical protein